MAKYIKRHKKPHRDMVYPTLKDGPDEHVRFFVNRSTTSGQQTLYFHYQLQKVPFGSYFVSSVKSFNLNHSPQDGLADLVQTLGQVLAVVANEPKDK